MRRQHLVGLLCKRVAPGVVRIPGWPRRSSETGAKKQRSEIERADDQRTVNLSRKALLPDAHRPVAAQRA